MDIKANYVDIFNKKIFPAVIKIKNGKIESVKKPITHKTISFPVLLTPISMLKVQCFRLRHSVK